MLGDYQIIETVYNSTFSSISKAVEKSTGQPVILKLLNKDFPSRQELSRFRAEFENTNALSEIKGVLPFKSLQSYENTLFMVREDVNAVPLTDFLQQHQPDFETRLIIATQLADILAQVHQHQVSHKDVNPSNLLWQEQQGQLYLIDFGVATKLRQEVAEFKAANQLEGTFAYISPEQTGRVNKPVDSRSDLYSLGVTLYELFTGRTPFGELSGIELVHAHIALAPESPCLKKPELPEALCAIILRLLAKSPDERYQTALGVHADLKLSLEKFKTGQLKESFTLGTQDFSSQFHVSNRLYGRKEEVNAIVAAFERTSQGCKELTLVSGYSGTGKSALVNEVHKPLTAKQGLFVSGKFDQYQSDIPYSGWVSVINEYVSLVLMEDEVLLQPLKERILEQLGTLAGIVTEFCPAVGTLIGTQHSVPELSGEQAKNRFYRALSAFFKAICHSQQPIVVFIDDWQWSDPGSMNLLRYLMNESDLNYLLMICAWRDNEVGSHHPFTLILKELAVAPSLYLNQVKVGNLSKTDVAQLVTDSLKSPAQPQELIERIYDKTGGNAFFVNQFLLNLHKEGLLQLEPQTGYWQANIQAIDEFSISDNVIDLMTRKLKKLDHSVLDALTLGACIGNKFELETLAVLLEQSTQSVSSLLEPMIREGLIKPLSSNWDLAQFDDKISDISYAFVHDRIQQAAYKLQDPQVAAEVHLKIFRTLSKAMSPKEVQEQVFKLVKHLNLSQKKITSKQDQAELIRLNVLAGKRAKQATAFVVARHYFEQALEAMPDSYWEHQLELASELYLLAAETAFLTKAFTKKEKWLKVLLSHQQDAIWRVKAYLIHIQSNTAQNKLVEAIECAREALCLLGLKLPPNPKDTDVLYHLLKTKWVVSHKTPEQLMAAGEITDEKILLALNVLGLTIPPAYWASPNLMLIIILHITRMLAKHGYSQIAGFGYAWWGIMECAVLGNIDKGVEFGRFGIELAQKHGLPVHQAQFYWGWIVKNYHHHVRDSISELSLAHRQALEVGDYEYASYALNNECQAKFHAALPLVEVLADMAAAQRDLAIYDNASSLYWHAIWHQTATNFSEPTEHPELLEGERYREGQMVPLHNEKNDASTLFVYHCAKLMLAVYFDHQDEVSVLVEQGRSQIKAAAGMYSVSLFVFYESLALLRSENLTKAALKQVQKNLKQLKKWAHVSPENHQHRVALVQAELFRVEGEMALAAEQYDVAAEKAKDQGFQQECGLIWEKAAEFYLERKRHGQAIFHLKQARYCYQLWQADNKLLHLSHKYKALMPLVLKSEQSARTSRISQTISGSSSGTQLDLATILKASQAISQEIVFDELIKKLLNLTLENAGAERGILFFKNEKGMRAAAGAETQADQIRYFTPSMEIADEDFSRAVFNVVNRTEQPLLLADAQQEHLYKEENYIHSNKIRSLFCMPIHHQGSMIGALYLENNLVSDAFTPERVELLSLLAGQLAISLVNANHYANLEAEVKARTAELERASIIDKLTQVYNRYKLDEELEREIINASDLNRSFSLILLDIDHFKAINDSFGHLVGDQVLEKFSSVLQAKLGLNFTLGRWGGEEFMIICPGLGASSAMTFAEELRMAISTADFGLNVKVTASFGVAEYDGEVLTRTLVKRADDALYRAKNGGRNRIVGASTVSA